MKQSEAVLKTNCLLEMVMIREVGFGLLEMMGLGFWGGFREWREKEKRIAMRE